MSGKKLFMSGKNELCLDKIISGQNELCLDKMIYVWTKWIMSGQIVNCKIKDYWTKR